MHDISNTATSPKTAPKIYWEILKIFVIPLTLSLTGNQLSI